MDMSKQMGFEIRKGWEPFEDFLRAIVDAVVEVKDAVSGRMGDKNVGVGGDSDIIVALAVGNTIPHKQRHPVEFDAIYFDAGVA